jgi:hypothetical protein
MFRRKIIINSQINGSTVRIRAALEDDFHHFRVEVVCEDEVVKIINATSPRTPYSLCGQAAAQLDQLIGLKSFPILISNNLQPSSPGELVPA